MHSISKVWHSKHWLAYLLWPLSLLYRLVISVRRYGYRLKIFKSTRVPVPVIIVGNLTVGGTGKTPLVIHLAQWLSSQGFRPGIISRGYGGKADAYPKFVEQHAKPAEVGDEAMLIAERTGCPVVVAPDRVAAARQLLEQHDCNILISDDGLQHYALARDVEIAVVDGKRRFGNGFCLPAGPLREPTSRLKTVDLIITNGQPQPGEYAMRLVAGELTHLIDPAQRKPLDTLRGQRVHAVAGIGHPQRFFDQLRHAGLEIIEHAFPDHHKFKAEDLQFAESGSIIMTEKDAVKCRQFAPSDCWSLPVDCQLDKDVCQKIRCRL